MNFFIIVLSDGIGRHPGLGTSAERRAGSNDRRQTLNDCKVDFSHCIYLNSFDFRA
jgi:hypothetical protein